MNIILTCVVFQIIQMFGQSVIASSEERKGIPGSLPAGNINQKSVQTILASIEEHLANLDAIYNIRYQSRTTAEIAEQNRKFDIINTKLDRIEKLVELKGDKLNELNRKMDMMQDTQNDKLKYMDIQIELGLSKIQNNFETSNRIERSVKFATNKMEEVERSVVDIKNYCNSTADYSNAATWRGSNCADQFTESMADKTTSIIKQQINYATSKINDEIWLRSQSIEKLLRDDITIANITRQECQNGFRHVLSRKNLAPFQADDKGYIEQAVTSLQMKMITMNATLDRKLGEIRLAQRFFSDTCHKIQANEPLLEANIINVLEKMVETIRTNRNELHLTQELLKDHDGHVISAVAYTNKLVLGSQEHFKELQRILYETKDSLADDWSTKNDAVANKIEEVKYFLQEIHYQLQSLEFNLIEHSNTTKIEQSSQLYNTNMVQNLSSILVQMENAIINFENTWKNKELVDQKYFESNSTSSENNSNEISYENGTDSNVDVTSFKNGTNLNSTGSAYTDAILDLENMIMRHLKNNNVTNNMTALLNTDLNITVNSTNRKVSSSEKQLSNNNQPDNHGSGTNTKIKEKHAKNGTGLSTIVKGMSHAIANASESNESTSVLPEYDNDYDYTETSYDVEP